MTVDTAPAPGRRTAPRWLVGVLTGLFGLCYAYAVWGAVGFLVQQVNGDAGLTGYGWFVLLMPVVFPAIVFAAAFVLTRRRGIVPLVLAQLTGLTLVAAFWMNVFALAVTSAAIYNPV